MSDKLEKQNLPVLSPDGSFNTYLQKIRKFPMLDAAEEYILAKNWRDKGDKESAHKLVTSHLRLVAKIATGYRGYGLPMSELVSEGNIGLMTAVKKFDPEKGFRLAIFRVTPASPPGVFSSVRHPRLELRARLVWASGHL